MSLYLLVFALTSRSCVLSYTAVHHHKGFIFSNKRYLHTVDLELCFVSFFLLYSFVFYIFVSGFWALWLCFHDLPVWFHCSSVFYKQHTVEYILPPSFFFFNPNWESFNRIVSWQSEEWIAFENTPVILCFLLISVVAVFPELFPKWVTLSFFPPFQ